MLLDGLELIAAFQFVLTLAKMEEHALVPIFVTVSFKVMRKMILKVPEQDTLVVYAQ